MPLRLRQGTDAERQAITFSEGEIVYVTDTKEVYVGDGTTLGGIVVSQSQLSLAGLTDVDITTTPPSTNDILYWDGSNFVPSTLADVAEGQSLSVDITGNVIGSIYLDDSTLALDATTGNFSTPGFVQFGSFTTTERNTISAQNGMVIYNTTAQRFQGFQNSSWINLDDGSFA